MQKIKNESNVFPVTQVSTSKKSFYIFWKGCLQMFPRKSGNFPRDHPKKFPLKSSPWKVFPEMRLLKSSPLKNVYFIVPSEKVLSEKLPLKSSFGKAPPWQFPPDKFFLKSSPGKLHREKFPCKGVPETCRYQSFLWKVFLQLHC